MAFQPFYVSTSGSYLNAGSTLGQPSVISTGGTWSSGVNLFVASAGTPFSSVASGEWASVYPDAATTTPFVGYIISVSGGGAGLEFSNTSFHGAKPTSVAGGASCRVGGEWAGPSGSTPFPFNFAAGTAVNASGEYPIVYFKGGVEYVISVLITTTKPGPVVFQGYTSTPGDGGFATIAQRTATSSFSLLTFNSAALNNYIKQFIFDTSANAGTSDLVTVSSAETVVDSCIFKNARGNGLVLSNAGQLAIGCEAFNCAVSPGANRGNFRSTAASTNFVRCIAHAASGSPSPGFQIEQASLLLNCISTKNRGDGIRINHNGQTTIIGCDIYGNGANGIGFSVTGPISLHCSNTNIISNSGYSIAANNNNICLGSVYNCGFFANVSGIQNRDLIMINSIDYSTIPYTDAPNGDFRLTAGHQARMGGIGNFLQTTISSQNNIGYPPIGALVPSGAASEGSVFNSVITGNIFNPHIIC